MGMQELGFTADYALTLGIKKVARMLESMSFGPKERIAAMGPMPGHISTQLAMIHGLGHLRIR